MNQERDEPQKLLSPKAGVDVWNIAQNPSINTQIEPFTAYLNQTRRPCIAKQETWKINLIAKNAILNQPETVTAWVEKYTPSNNYRNVLVRNYLQFLKFCKLKTEMKMYPKDSKEIRCPNHEKIMQIIAHAGKTMSLKLQLSLETGLRPVELLGLKAKDIDTDQRIIYPTTAKHGAPRKLKISQPLNQRLLTYIIKNNIQQNQQIFKGDEIRYGKEYRVIRNRLAKQLNDPAIHNIRLYDFRHFFGTMTYIKTNSVKETQYRMGHKHSNTTDIYVHVIESSDPEYIVESTQDQKRADELLTAGFNYCLTTPDGYMKFRKAKGI